MQVCGSEEQTPLRLVYVALVQEIKPITINLLPNRMSLSDFKMSMFRTNILQLTRTRIGVLQQSCCEKVHSYNEKELLELCSEFASVRLQSFSYWNKLHVPMHNSRARAKLQLSVSLNVWIRLQLCTPHTKVKNYFLAWFSNKCSVKAFVTKEKIIAKKFSHVAIFVLCTCPTLYKE